MKKRGQIGIYFILVMITLLIAGTVVWTIYGQETSLSSEVKGSVEALFDGGWEAFATSCMEKMAKDGILFIAPRGGYFEMPVVYYSSLGQDIAFYIYEGNDISPTASAMAGELFKYIRAYIKDCLALEGAGDFNIEILKLEPLLDNTDNVFLMYFMELGIEGKKGKKITKSFRFEVTDMRLVKILEMVNMIREDALRTPSVFCLNCVTRMADENGYIPYFETPVPGIYHLQLMSKDDPKFVFNMVMSVE